MTTITESPVFVLFNPAARNVASKDLPITLYESGAWMGAETASPLGLSHAPALAELHVVGDAPVLTFVKSAYTIEVRRTRALLCPLSRACSRAPSAQSGEAERIAVDHVARVVQTNATSSSAQRMLPLRC